MNDTLEKWGKTAEQYVRRTDTAVVLHVDEDEIVIPVEDTTKRKALWADALWIVARFLETGAETVSGTYERAEGLLLAGERLAALCRHVVQYKGYVARSITLARCLDAYDVAKRRARAPTVYERLRGPSDLAGEPQPEPSTLEASTEDKGWKKAPSMPEPETEALYQVLYCWQARLKVIDEELSRSKADHQDTDPQAPCPEDLGKAYDRFYKAKNVVGYLEAAINEQLGEHLGTITDDSKDFPSEIRFQINTVVLGAGGPSDPTP